MKQPKSCLHRTDLAAITNALLSAATPPGELRAAAEALGKLLSSLSGVQLDSSLADDCTYTMLPTGKAIAPREAARCVMDFQRTAKFLRGVEAAILAAQQRFSSRPIEVLYAGCGPFATLAVPLMTRLAPDDVRFTLLDIHRRSLDAAHLLIEQLDLAGFVREYVPGDAGTYQQPADRSMHVLVVETMQSALAKEPQVAVTCNLARQLCPGGLLVPERIAVDAVLLDIRVEVQQMLKLDSAPTDGDSRRVTRGREHLACLFELTADTWREQEHLARSSTSTWPPVVARVPDWESDRLGIVTLCTRIQVFDSIELSNYQAGVTYPVMLHELGDVGPGTRIEFKYISGPVPGFDCRRLPEE